MFAIVLIVLVACIIVPFSVGYMLAFSDNTSASNNVSSFTLTATGTAFDEQAQKNVNVSIAVTGTADGKTDSTININTRGGDVTVEGYDVLTVSSGSGTLSQADESTFTLDITAQYGGTPVTWTLNNVVASAEEKTFTVNLSADNVALPLEGNGELSNLSLTGTVGFE